MAVQVLHSRQVLLARIQSQFEFGERLIQLLGEPGVGKTYLAELFVTEHYQDHNKAFVTLNAKHTEHGMMAQLLEQTFVRPAIDSTQSLAANFNRLADEHGVEPTVWVIDNAQHLTDELLSSVQFLTEQSHRPILVLLVATSPVNLMTLHAIKVPPLAEHEAVRFMGFFFADLPPSHDPIFASFIASCGGNPKLLLAWNKDIKMPEAPSKDGSFTWLPWLAAALVILLGAGVFFIVYQDAPSDPRESQTEPLVNAQPDSPEPTLALDALTQQGAIQQAKEALEDSSPLLSDGSQLTPKVDVASTEKDSDEPNPQDRDVPSDLEPAVELPESSKLEESANSAQILADLLERKHSKPLKQVTSNAAKREAMEEPLAAESSSNEGQAAVESSNKLASEPLRADNAWYLDDARQGYVLQLMAAKDKKLIEDLQTRLATLTTHIYVTQRFGGDWWALTHGDFNSLSAANAAKSGLLKSTPELSAFAKNVSQIQSEIRASGAARVATDGVEWPFFQLNTHWHDSENSRLPQMGWR